jgi:hypothetical protein
MPKVRKVNLAISEGRAESPNRRGIRPNGRGAWRRGWRRALVGIRAEGA